MMGITLKNTFKPGEMEKLMAAGQQKTTEKQGKEKGRDSAGTAPQEDVDISKFSVAEMMAVEPGDPNEPGALYENMLKEIIGYSVQGVIWYQGETDNKKPHTYGKLFSAMIACWRKEWKEKNTAMDRLPFLFVQLAPFGTWRDNLSEAYPVLRRQQELVSKTVQDAYMTSISDIGNVYDIHPKVKKPVGQRLALLALKYVYGLDIPADPPEAAGLERERNSLRIRFRNGDGLYKKECDFSSYNGFVLSDIREDLIPPVLDKTGGLQVYADGEAVTEAVCSAENGQLIIRSHRLEEASHIQVEFAQTGFYQVNLYNGAGLPAKPFSMETGGAS